MKPIFITLFAAIVTIVLTLFLPRPRWANRRRLAISAAVGLAVLLILVAWRIFR